MTMPQPNLFQSQRTATDDYMTAFRANLENEKLMKVIEEAFAAGYRRGYADHARWIEAEKKTP